MLSYYQDKWLEAGCDEAGRGCLAGPVFAAAVILPKNYQHPHIRDSKKLSEKMRYQLRTDIERDAIAWSVQSIDPQTIDQINILNASIQAMHLALTNLSTQPEFIIVDGNKFRPYSNIPHKTIVKGDDKFYSIAAASILAKTYRDDYMLALSQEFPQYAWHKNKGYPTAEHRAAIQSYGTTPHHRLTFHF